MKVIKYWASVLVLVLFAGACFVANTFFGNPVSWLLSNLASQEHLLDNYSNTDYYIKDIQYSFKDSGYHAEAVTDSSADGSFTIYIDMLGKVERDDHAYRVTEHGNVANRLYDSYRDAVDSVIAGEAYPYSVDLGFGDLCFDFEEGIEPSPDAVLLSSLENDKEYDVSLIGKTNGILILYIDTDDVTAARASEVLLKTREMMDESGIGFYAVDLTLRYAPTDKNDPATRPEGEINIFNFKYADIAEDGMAERVESAIEATKEYYESLGKEPELEADPE